MIILYFFILKTSFYAFFYVKDFLKKLHQAFKLKDWVLNSDHLRLFTPFIMSVNPMSEEEAKAVQNIWSLSIIDRWRLYRLWIQMTSNILLPKMKILEDEYATTIKKLVEFRSLGDIELMREAKVSMFYK